MSEESSFDRLIERARSNGGYFSGTHISRWEELRVQELDNRARLAKLKVRRSASPKWQLVHAGITEFDGHYEYPEDMADCVMEKLYGDEW